MLWGESWLAAVFFCFFPGSVAFTGRGQEGFGFQLFDFFACLELSSGTKNSLMVVHILMYENLQTNEIMEFFNVSHSSDK